MCSLEIVICIPPSVSLNYIYFEYVLTSQTSICYHKNT